MVSQTVSSSNSTGNDMEHPSKSDVDSCNKKAVSRSEESHEQVRKKVRSNDSVFIDMSEFKDRDIPIFVEACAGSATLSFSIQRRGFEVYPIDHVRNRHQTQCRVLQLDLTLPSTWELLRRITDDYFCAGFHFGVPCGAERVLEHGESRYQMGPRVHHPFAIKIMYWGCQIFQRPTGVRWKRQISFMNGVASSFFFWRRRGFRGQWRTPRTRGYGICRVLGRSLQEESL